MTVTHPAGGLGWRFRHALVSGQAVFVGGWYGSDEKVSSALPAGASARAAWAGSAVAPRPTTAPLGLRPSFIHDQIAVAEEASVQHLDGLRGFFPRGHLHESEPTRSPCELIGDDANRPHGPGMLEELSHVFCRSLEREIPDEESREHHAPPTARRTERPSSQLVYGVWGIALPTINTLGRAHTLSPGATAMHPQRGFPAEAASSGVVRHVAVAFPQSSFDSANP
jgi:hypothetical protein